MATIVQAMAGYSEDDWQFVQGRWDAIRAFHRQYILGHPGCIAIDETITDPDPALQATRRAARQRLERQQWLSRLLVATPRLLAAVEYARIRRQIEPDGAALLVEKGKGRGRGDGGHPIIMQMSQSAVSVATPEAPAPDLMVPIGFVSGATPRPGTVVTVPQIADGQTSAAVMETRGRRRAKDDIADGFEDLTAPPEDEQEERTG
jgi:hypothetical protein